MKEGEEYNEGLCSEQGRDKNSLALSMTIVIHIEVHHEPEAEAEGDPLVSDPLVSGPSWPVTLWSEELCDALSRYWQATQQQDVFGLRLKKFDGPEDRFLRAGK